MKLTFWGALLGAVLLTIAAPAGAATVTGTSTVNPVSVQVGDPAATFNLGGATGINGAVFDPGQRYFDYIFSFSVTDGANVALSATATVGTNIADYHAALFSSSPAGTALNVIAPGLTTSLTSTTGLIVSAVTSGNGSTNTLNAFNLAAGTYYLRLFGVINGNSGANSKLFALNGSIAATPIPAALPLMMSALGLLGFAGWRRRASATAAAA